MYVPEWLVVISRSNLTFFFIKVRHMPITTRSCCIESAVHLESDGSNSDCLFRSEFASREHVLVHDLELMRHKKKRDRKKCQCRSQLRIDETQRDTYIQHNTEVHYITIHDHSYQNTLKTASHAR